MRNNWNMQQATGKNNRYNDAHKHRQNQQDRQRLSYYPLPFFVCDHDAVQEEKHTYTHTSIDQQDELSTSIQHTNDGVHSRPLRPHTNTRTPTCMHAYRQQPNAIDIPNTYYGINMWNLSLSRKKQNNIFILVLVRAASYVLATGFPVKLSCSNFVQAFPRLDSSNSDDI